jgi:hypothetical protein
MYSFEQIEKTIKPFRDVEEKLRLTSKFHETVEHFDRVQRTFENIGRLMASIPKFNHPILESLKSFEEIGNRLKEYEAKTPGYLLLIAQNGWYIELDSEMKMPSAIAKLFQENQTDRANEKLIEYYDNNLIRIFETLEERHSNRKDIFKQILSSYNNGNYYVIIPCILSQIDGVCFDFTQKKFFIKEKDNNYLPQISAELEKSTGSFLIIFLSPLKNQTPIMVQEKQISNFPCKLNRHEILHGINTDYGTKMNSLKVISLLKYISDLLIEIDSEH